MFRPLERNASTPELMDLANYMASTWIVETSEWPSSSWSAHMKLIDTNNDVEGWHLRLNRQASGKSQLPFYLLVKLLHKEALLSNIPPNSPRLGEEASEDPERKVQKAAIETV